jgi:hypothetical protein
LRNALIQILLLFIFSGILGGCSTEAMSFSQGFLEGYNEKMREERYINNMIRLEQEKQKTYQCIYQQNKEYCK